MGSKSRERERERVEKARRWFVLNVHVLLILLLDSDRFQKPGMCSIRSIMANVDPPDLISKRSRDTHSTPTDTYFSHVSSDQIEFQRTVFREPRCSAILGFFQSEIRGRSFVTIDAQDHIGVHTRSTGFDQHPVVNICRMEQCSSLFKWRDSNIPCVMIQELAFLSRQLTSMPFCFSSISDGFFSNRCRHSHYLSLAFCSRSCFSCA